MKRLLLFIDRNIVFVLLVLFFVTIPLKNSLNSAVILALTTVSIYLLIRGKKFNLEIFKTLSPFLLFFLIMCLSFFYSADKSYALKSIQRYLPFLVFPFIFSVIQIKTEEIYKLFKIFIAWILTLTLYAHILVLIKLNSNNDVLFNLFNRHYSYMSLSSDTIGIHPAYFALLLQIGILFLTFFFFRENNLRNKILYIIISLYFTFFIFHLSVRTSIVALFIYFNLAILYYIYSKKNFWKGILSLIILYIVIGTIGYNVRVTRYRFQHLFGFTYSSGIRHDDGADKLKQWHAALQANDNFIFGNGIGDANNSIYTSYENNELDKFATREYNAHNQFIQTYVAVGFVGVLILLLLFSYYFHLFYQNKLFIGASFLIIIFLLFQTESYFQRHKGIVIFSYTICFFVSYLFSKEVLKGKVKSNNNHKKLY